MADEDQTGQHDLTDHVSELATELELRQEIQRLRAAERELAAREAALQIREERHRILLRERQVLLRNIIDHAPMTICAMDLDGNFILVNRLFATRAGSDHPRDLLGRPIAAAFPDAMAQRFLEENRQILRHGQTTHTEDLDLRSGTPEDWLVTKFPIYDQDRLMLGIGAIAMNVTDQRRLAREYEHFFTITPDLLAIVSLERGIKRFNPAWERILGYTQEQLSSQLDLLNLIHPEDRERTLTLIAPIRERSGTITYENRYRCQDGSYKWLEWTITSYFENEPVFYACARDMTERRLAAERLEYAYQEMSRANVELARVAQLRDEFLANMSHELRTPLNAVLGLAETLQEGLYGTVNERQLRSLRGISESGRHLLDLINDVLDLSKVEAGKLEIHPQMAVVDQVCQSSLRLVKQAAHQKAISVAYERDPAANQVWCDERRLRQILINLLTNAVKFTPVGGEVGLTVGVGAAGQIEFCVWDNGIGIASEHLPHLFQPFTQLDSSLVRQHGGTGLGLVIARRLAELHAGTIEVQSALGSGSRFLVRIPHAPSHGDRKVDPTPKLGSQHRPVNAPRGQSAAVPRARNTILLVDDHVDNRTMLMDYLVSRSYLVHTAGDGRTAVALAGELNPDLILMDVQMPEMNGMDAIAAIRQLPNHGQTPIIALTAHAMPSDRERCIAAGASDYLTKPVRLRSLVELIAAHLDSGVRSGDA